MHKSTHLLLIGLSHHIRSIAGHIKSGSHSADLGVPVTDIGELKKNKNQLFLAAIFWKYTFEYKLVYAENTTKAQDKIHDLYKDTDKKPEGINIQEPII